MAKFKLFIYRLFLTVLKILRNFIEIDVRFYSILGHRYFQKPLSMIAKARALNIYDNAVKNCPAYKQFIDETGVEKISSFDDFHKIPEMTKENYVKKYSLPEQCYGGKIPSRGVVVDESSGSSGEPTNWLRGPQERSSVKKTLQLTFSMLHSSENVFALNCFALGPWATGMNVSMSLIDVSILKSIGPEISKLENTLKKFGTSYRYIVMGYPPFIKSFVDNCNLDLSNYDIHTIMGGEGQSEGMRSYLLTKFKSVFSSYGASDLEINIAIETDLSIELRQACLTDPELNKALFGTSETPMIFQFNPLDYIVETNESGELLFTVLRAVNVCPKVRYNIKDRGGMLDFFKMENVLKSKSKNLNKMKDKFLSFPFLYIFGRNDLTVSFYGANILPGDFERLINEDAELVKAISSFRYKAAEDSSFNKELHIYLELTSATKTKLDVTELQTRFYKNLQNINQDFREVSKMFGADKLKISIFENNCGPFEGRDKRIKNAYIA